MALSTAISVASFSVVMAETFAAVSVSTLVPATFLAMLRAAKKSAGAANDNADALIENMVGVKQALGAVKAGIDSIDEIDLLIPKTATIHGEFEFEASEAYSENSGFGAVVNVVAVAAAYSALYQTSSRNKVTLDVEFATVNYTLS
ncbi:hypothetical protein [Bauldia litoralis]|uniref:hypothetical protein n=1 Tax=Bauldia litoralis TaxID=665467 RepID=UPI0032659D47